MICILKRLTTGEIYISETAIAKLDRIVDCADFVMDHIDNDGLSKVLLYIFDKLCCKSMVKLHKDCYSFVTKCNWLN